MVHNADGRMAEGVVAASQGVVGRRNHSQAVVVVVVWCVVWRLLMPEEEGEESTEENKQFDSYMSRKSLTEQESEATER